MKNLAVAMIMEYQVQRLPWCARKTSAGKFLFPVFPGRETGMMTLLNYQGSLPL